MGTDETEETKKSGVQESKGDDVEGESRETDDDATQEDQEEKNNTTEGDEDATEADQEEEEGAAEGEDDEAAVDDSEEEEGAGEGEDDEAAVDDSEEEEGAAEGEDDEAAVDDSEGEEGAAEGEDDEAPPGGDDPALAAEEDGELSPWDEKMHLAVQLWEAGNNARLREVLDELEKAPVEQKAVHRLVEEYRRRLKPDPIAIGLWLLTLFIFCLLTYLYVLR